MLVCGHQLQDINTVLNIDDKMLRQEHIQVWTTVSGLHIYWITAD